MSLRSAVLVLLALVTGAIAAFLMIAAGHQIAEAILTGLTTMAASIWWYDRLIA